MSRRRYRFAEAKARAARPPRGGGCRALLVVDNAPLQKAAWRDLGKARKLLEKASRDLHRHEQVDLPGFRAWLGATFPDLVSAVRELMQECEAKKRIVYAVESEAFVTGRSPRVIWRAWQRMESNQPKDATSSGDDAHDNTDGKKFGDVRDSDPWTEDNNRGAPDSFFRKVCADSGLDPDDPAVQDRCGKSPDMAGFAFHFGGVRSLSNEGREIYRRLVQQLHPDRGGEWTPQRARVWHEVQEAWAARDADLLARLEAEWEIAADTLSLTSPVGRLRAALEEIHAARRDAENKVRRYRKSAEWRFSLSTPDAHRREAIRRSLESERDVLRRHVGELEAMISRWQKSPNTCARRGEKPKPTSAAQDRFGFGFGAG